MSRLRKILYIVSAIVLFLVVYVVDVIQSTVNLENITVDIAREFVLLIAFMFLFFYLRSTRIEKRENRTKELGKLLVTSVILIFLSIAASYLPILQFVEKNNFQVPANVLTALSVSFLSIILGILTILILLVVMDLVLHKRKKAIKRNSTILLAGMIGTILFAFPFVSEYGGIVGTISYGFTILMVLVVSFKQSWIVYLSRREKFYTLVYSALSVIAFIVLLVFVNDRGFVGKGILFYSHPLERFVKINLLFGTIYFGMAFVSTLFHLPTADVYERKQSELTSLHNLSRLVAQVFDFRDLVHTVTQMTREVCDAKSAWLELIRYEADAKHPDFEVVATNKISKNDVHLLMNDPKSTLRQIVMDSKKVVHVDSVREDRRTSYIKDLGFQTESLLSVPLLSQQTIIGILHATSDEAYAFDQEDIGVMNSFADHVTIAIENARLIEQSLERERYHQEILLAQQMQRRLLPQSVPQNGAFDIAAISEPSLEVGGDYYDFVQLENDRLGIVVGDVSGKGISAAFYMAEMKGIFQSLSKTIQSPRELIVRANETLYATLERKAFVSFLYAIFDLHSSTVLLARAGHTPMIHISGESVNFIRPRGLGLGLTQEQIFHQSAEEFSISLKPKDICIFYTDGLVEVRNSEEEEYGVERLIGCIKKYRQENSLTIQQHIWSDVKKFIGGKEFSDDLTLLIVQWYGFQERDQIS